MLSKQQALAELRFMPATPVKYMDLLREIGVKTGSEVYAPFDFKVDSDRDYLIFGSPAIFDGYAVYSGGDYNSDGWASIYIKDLTDAVYNVLCFSDRKLYEAWITTTEIMKAIVQEFPYLVETKWKRVRMFQAIKDCVHDAPLAIMPSFGTIVKHRLCLNCGKKADFFYNAQGHEIYKETGICVRCQDKDLTK